MATIKDVAYKAGVSVGTVSNYINGKTNVNDEKIKKIKDAMKELQYHPNYMAQNLKGKRNKIIGIIFPSLEEPYNDVYRGIEEFLDMHNYMTVLKLSQNNKVLENRYIDHLINMGASGIILVSCDCTNLEKFEDIEKRGISLGFAERKIREGSFRYILFENKELVFDIVNLINAQEAKKDIKIFLGKLEFTSEKDCAEGYIAANGDGETDIIEIPETNEEAIFNHIYSKIIGFEKIPDCIITSSVEFAKILSEVCNILKINIPIHAIAGENWYMTDIQKNVTLYGRNAILMGQQAGKSIHEQLQNRHQPETNTVYIKSKKIYSDPVITKIQGTKQQETKPKIRILSYHCDATNALKKLAASYEHNRGIEIDFDELGYTELHRKLSEECATELSDYDIFMIDLPWLRGILASGKLSDITKQVKEDNLLSWFPRSVRNVFYRGDLGVHSLPIIATTQVLMYRRDIFNDADIKAQFTKSYGFDLSVPNTWSNFNTVAEFFTRSVNPRSPFTYGTAASALEPVGLINEFLPRQWAFHGEIVDKWGKLSIDSDENRRALDNLVRTFDYVPKASENYFWDEIFEMLLKGEIPMAHGFASHYQPGNYSQKGNTYEKYIGAVQLPGKRPMVGGWVLGINKHSNIKNECYEFIKWNLSDRIAVENMRLCGCVPTMTVFQDDTLKGSYPWLKMVDEKVALGRLREEVFDKDRHIINTELIDHYISKGIKKALHKEVTTREALDEIKTDIQQLMTK
jgi:multiple sugar transport system substrate-binding protein